MKRAGTALGLAHDPPRVLRITRAGGLVEVSRELKITSVSYLIQAGGQKVIRIMLSFNGVKMPVTSKSAPAPPVRYKRNELAPYKRCRCGLCRQCIDNEKWDRRFAKFEVNVYWDERGVFGSTLRNL
jgi:hypothetical protein